MVRSACSVDEFSSLIRQLPGCCSKTGWSARRLALPAFNLCLVSFSPLQQLFTYSDIGRGLLVDCLFHAVFHFFMHCDHLEEARQAVLDPESWKCPIWLSADKPPASPGPNKNPFRWSLPTPLQLINMSVHDACVLFCITLTGLCRWHVPCPSPGCSWRQVGAQNMRRCNKYFGYSCNTASMSQGCKSWASQRP